MGLCKRVFMGIIRRPFRAIILMLTILVLSIMSTIGVFLKDIVNSYYQEFIKIDGYSIFVENKDSDKQKAIPDEIRDEILSLCHIVGYNNAEDLFYNYKPIGFENVPYKGKNVYEQNDDIKNITLCGNVDTSLYDTFRNGYMKLKKGRYPDSDNRGVIVDSILAAKNSLSIGCTIELYNGENDKTVSFGIIGIYETLKAPEIKVENKSGTFYTVSPNSYIFCDYNSYKKISSINQKISSLKFYVDEYDNIEETYHRIEDIALPEQGYFVVNCLENSLSCYGTVIITLKNVASNILSFTYITSLIILFLMTLLWMRDHYYEVGIYIALGSKKIIVVMYFILEILVIVIVTLCVSLIIGCGVIYTFGEQFVNLAMDFTNVQIFDMNLETKVMANAFSIRSLICMEMFNLSIVLIATILSSVSIVSYKTRKLLA